MSMTAEELKELEKFKQLTVCTEQMLAKNPDWTMAYTFGAAAPLWFEGHLTEQEIENKLSPDRLHGTTYTHFSYGESLTTGMIY